MRATAGPIWDLWDSGGPFFGVNRAHGRVTVEVGWQLRESAGAVGSWSAAKLPIRWFQRADNSQTETEVPNVRSIHIVRSLDNDAGTCELEILNQQMTPAQLAELGNPGYFSPNRGADAAATTRWGHAPNEWAGVLTPNALLRTYEGWGGYNSDGTAMSIPAAVAAGNLWLTGVWLIDSVAPDTTGVLKIQCRDMAKLLLEQPIYPPLVRPINQGGVYPLHYSRFFYNDVTTPYIAYGTAAGGVKIIVGLEVDPVGGDGYWLIGDDGGVFTYGNTLFFGSLAGDVSHAVVGAARTPDGGGYWLATKDGNVFGYGNTTIQGGTAPATGFEMVAIERAGTNEGYFLCDTGGHVYAIGAATYHGGGPGTSPIIGMAVNADGSGYWLLDDTGHVYAYGAVPVLGNPPSAGSPFCAIAATPSGNGYYIADKVGHVYAFGDAVYHGGTQDIRLNDPITDIAVRPDNAGYWLVAEDGGIFTFGNIPFYGALPAAFTIEYTADGNYFDYVDIVKDLLLWGGFWLYAPTGDPIVNGALESSGTYATDAQGGIPDDWFDKRPLMDGITRIKEILGYAAWVDANGGFHFESPGWWTVGNVLPDGTKSSFVPDVDERVQLISYGTASDDKTARDRVIITNTEPNYSTSEQPQGIVWTEVATPDVSILKGQLRPIIWPEVSVTDAAQQQIMADLLNRQLAFAQRLGNTNAFANPLIELNDQVRIWERITDETNIHYVRGIETNHDLDAGTYTMTLTTHWLPGFDVPGPGTIRHPQAIDSAEAVGAPTITIGAALASIASAEAVGLPTVS